MTTPTLRHLVVGLLILPAVCGPTSRAADPTPVPAPAPAAAAPGVPALPPVKPWDASIALGFNLTSGNSETLLLTLSYRARKEWEKDIWTLGADGAYGKDHSTVNNEKAGGFAEYKRLLTERLYASLHLDIISDSIVHLDYRVTVGPALGYFFMKSPVTQFNGEIGPSLVVVRTDVNHPNVATPPDDVTVETQSYIALRLAEHFEHEFKTKAKIWESIEFLPQVDDFNNYLVNAEVGTEAVLSGHLNLRVVAQDRYNSQPPPHSKSNDISLTTALVYKFH